MAELREKGEPRLITLGCRLNNAESAAMRDLATAAGLRDTIIVNSCAVTGEAERQTRQAIRKARRENPKARIVVTGCAAQISPDTFAAMPEIDLVLGNAEKLDPASYRRLAAAEPLPRQVVGDIMALKETAAHLAAAWAERCRAFVEIQQGCDHRCTFCIIPFGRGNNRSVPAEILIADIRRLVAAGYREIVLTGVDITGYGADLPETPSLGRLVARILADVPELPRLRLSSLDVVEIDSELRELLAGEARLMPHLHLSLQSGDDMILKRMKRRHDREDAIRFCRDLRRQRPDIVFGADLIAGFPTETDAMFENSLSLVAECDLTFLHVFPFSARVGTPAARMPQIPGNIRKARAARLRAAGEAARNAYFARRLGTPERVLIESVDAGGSFGHSDHFLPVRLKGAQSAAVPGAILELRLAAQEGDRLIGEIPAAIAA